MKTNHEIQQEWEKLLMQGSDLEKVERKHAEMAFAIREKELTIFKNFASVQNKLENGHLSILDVLKFEEKLALIEKSLNEEKTIDQKIQIKERRLDCYFRLNGGECQENGYAQLLDEQAKIFLMEPTVVHD